MVALIGVIILIMLLHTAVYVWAPGDKGIANVFAPRLVAGDVSPRYEAHASPAWFRQPDIPVLPSYWLGYNFPLSRLPEFYCGVLAGRLVAEGRWNNVRMRWPLAILALAYAATWIVPVDYKMSALLVAPMVAVVATLAARDLAGIRGLNSRPAMLWLGNIAFAFYLIRFPAMTAVTWWYIGGRRFGLLGWLAIVGICLVLAGAATAIS